MPDPRTDPTIESPGTVIGNHTQKYTSANPAIRWLTQRFLASLSATVEAVVASSGPPVRPLEVGAGEGVIAAMLHQRFGSAVALDLPDAGLRTEWVARPGPGYLHADAGALPFPAGRFDLVVCVEVLEHLADPAAGLAEIARVGCRDLILSVPREPIFRTCNLLSGRYVGALGNTPGHLNHWSRNSFTRFVGGVGRVRRVATPFPWTIAWVSLD